MTGKAPQFDTWFAINRPAYERLTLAVVALLQGILKNNNIEFLSVDGRTKTLLSATEKSRRKNYSKPETQMTDLSGIRIVTFLEEQVDQISKVIETLFAIDSENSLDRSKSLGPDRMGYRSAHFVCSLGKKRTGLPEYEGLEALKFEIQLRTVLQHAWAELAHDRSFKFKTVLPVALQRKLNLYSGMLEIVDNGFDEIAKEIDTYAASIAAKPIDQLSDEELTSISVNKYLSGAEARYGLVLRAADSTTLVQVT